jgi:hypothetical protein
MRVQRFVIKYNTVSPYYVWASLFGIRYRICKTDSFVVTDEIDLVLLNRNFSIPIGFKTDHASVPWFLRWWINPHGRIRWAALVHDAIYVHFRHVFTREEADKIFLAYMKEYEMKWIFRVTAYAYVRLLGGLTWNDKIKNV